MLCGRVVHAPTQEDHGNVAWMHALWLGMTAESVGYYHYWDRDYKDVAQLNCKTFLTEGNR